MSGAADLRETGGNDGLHGFGSWAIGGDWGPLDDTLAMATLHAAVDAGVTFFDTADVHGDGHSELLLARLRSERDDELVIATKVGAAAPTASRSLSTWGSRRPSA